jgi:hypothetical protein
VPLASAPLSCASTFLSDVAVCGQPARTTTQALCGVVEPKELVVMEGAAVASKVQVCFRGDACWMLHIRVFFFFSPYT